MYSVCFQSLSIMLICSLILLSTSIIYLFVKCKEKRNNKLNEDWDRIDAKLENESIEMIFIIDEYIYHFLKPFVYPHTFYIYYLFIFS